MIHNGNIHMLSSGCRSINNVMNTYELQLSSLIDSVRIIQQQRKLHSSKSFHFISHKFPLISGLSTSAVTGNEGNSISRLYENNGRYNDSISILDDEANENGIDKRFLPQNNSITVDHTANSQTNYNEALKILKIDNSTNNVNKNDDIAMNDCDKNIRCSSNDNAHNAINSLDDSVNKYVDNVVSNNNDDKNDENMNKMVDNILIIKSSGDVYKNDVNNAVIKLFNETLEENSKLRAIIEYTVDNNDRMMMSKDPSFQQYQHHRSIELNKQWLVEQMIRMRSLLEDERRRCYQLQVALDINNYHNDGDDINLMMVSECCCVYV